MIHSDEHTSHPSMIDNSWYQSMMEKARNVTNETCFVCATLPHAVGTGSLYHSKELSKEERSCMLPLIHCRIQATFQPWGIRWRGTSVNASGLGRPLQRINKKSSTGGGISTLYPQLTCTQTTGNTGGCLKKAHFEISGTDGEEHRNGVEYCLGSLSEGNDTTNDTYDLAQNLSTQCNKTWEQRITGILNLEGLPPVPVMKHLRWESCVKGTGSQQVGNNTNCNSTTMNELLANGTTAILDVYWQCGHLAYIQLPPDWGGVCSLVVLQEATLVMNMTDFMAIHHQEHSKEKTFLHHKKRDSFGKEEWLAIPEEFRLFTEGEIYWGSVLPFAPFQAKKTARWLQITRYELMKTINSTIEGFAAIKEELRALRITVLQNRLVLDQLTAAEGGVCKKLGSTCCTFIPRNDEDNGTLTAAIHHLKELQHQMEAESPGAQASLDWLFSVLSWIPSWLWPWMRWGLMFLCLLAAFYCCCTCCLPMLLKGCSRGTAAATQMTLRQQTTITVRDDNGSKYILIPQEECSPVDDTSSKGGTERSGPEGQEPEPKYWHKHNPETQFADLNLRDEYC